MTTTSKDTRPTTKEAWLKALKADLRARDKKGDFTLRLTGEIVGTCPTTVGYIAKITHAGEPTSYYACKELHCIFQSFMWHICYHWEINAKIKSKIKKDAGYKKEYTIFKTDSLTKAIKFLKLEN